MPLRKSHVVPTIALAAAFGAAALPATASAGIFSNLFAPKKTTTTTTSTTATTPKATTTTATSAGVTTTAAATTPADSATTSSAVPSGVGCTPLPTVKSFKKVDGDDSDYSLAPNGDFENGAGGWTLSNGAKVVNVNENLGVSAGRRALQIPLSGSVTSPAFCVDETKPHFRFAYKVDNAALSGFIAYVIYRDAAGKVQNVELVSSKTLALAPSMWQASPKSPLATIIPLNSSTKTASVQLKITSLNPTDFVLDTSEAIIGQNAATDLVHTVGSAGSNLVATISGAVAPIANIGITIDSVMVDPYRRG